VTVRRVLPALMALAVLVSGCGNGSDAAPPAPAVRGDAGSARTTAYDAAVSRSREDTVYPDVGDPGVDALHYDLRLAWDPRTETLTGTETIVLRATRTADHLQLDLAHQLEVGHVWLDGHSVDFSHTGKDLVVEAAVSRGSRRVLQLTYSGTPEPVVAPTDRGDFETTGWTTTRAGEVWTMQEPYGAYSWYAVHDQPSDKAFYDLTIESPKEMVGVANGRLVSRRTVGDHTVTHWNLPEPAASYLITIAIGRYTETRDTGPHGLPISYWTPSDRPALVTGLRYTPRAVAYLEAKLGRYPFPTLGILVVPSSSAMETQSMVTLGMESYNLSRDVLVHELGHQWYGDEVGPDDWSDLWMNEGMATYLAEANWTADHTARSRSSILRGWNRVAPQLRSRYGPPADYAPASFAEGNAYYLPALMWDTIRQRLGDATFWRLAAAWPSSHRFTSQDRATLAAWWSRESGEDLTALFHPWLLGPTQPTWHG
jgi:aminopeptidase N